MHRPQGYADVAGHALQRGRPQLRAECKGDFNIAIAEWRLQRGRPQLRAECASGRPLAHHRQHASTGPPSIEGGMKVQASGLVRHTPSFNGAALN